MLSTVKKYVRIITNYDISSRRKTICYNNWKNNTVSKHWKRGTNFVPCRFWCRFLIGNWSNSNKHGLVCCPLWETPSSFRRYKADFQSWKNSYLQEYLAERSINKIGNKYGLFKNAYRTYCLNLPVIAIDYLEEQEKIKKNYKMKFILEKGFVTLPDPVTLKECWYSATENLPNTVQTLQRFSNKLWDVWISTHNIKMLAVCSAILNVKFV